MKIKKVLLATLTVLSFVGLTACSNKAKKLSEEEAKTLYNLTYKVLLNLEKENNNG